LTIDVGEAAAHASVTAGLLDSTIGAPAFREQDRPAHRASGRANARERVKKTAKQTASVLQIDFLAQIHKASLTLLSTAARRSSTGRRQPPLIF
jgi:hypothetical protein